MAPRRQLSTRARLNLFLAHKGRCASCTLPIPPGKGWDIDHIIPLALGGSDTTDNMQILCRSCHANKTTEQDLPMIAKIDRIRAKHLGAKYRRRPLPGGKYDKYMKKLDGSVQKRSK